MVEKTNIEVTDETWGQLNARKRPGDTFDDVVNRVLDERDELQDRVDELAELFGPVRIAIAELDLPGQGDVVDERRRVVGVAVNEIRLRGEASKAEILELVGNQGGYDSPESLWKNALRPALTELSGNVDALESPGEGGAGWRWVE